MKGVVREVVLFTVVASIFFSLPAFSYELGLQGVSGRPGETVTLYVTVDDVDGLLSADMSVSYDPGYLTFEGAQTTDLVQGFSIAYTLKGEVVSLSMAGARPAPSGSGNLLALSFAISESAPSGDLPLRLTEAVVYGPDRSSQAALALGDTGASITVTSTPSPEPQEEAGGSGGCWIGTLMWHPAEHSSKGAVTCSGDSTAAGGSRAIQIDVTGATPGTCVNIPGDPTSSLKATGLQRKPDNGR